MDVDKAFAVEEVDNNELPARLVLPDFMHQRKTDAQFIQVNPQEV